MQSDRSPVGSYPLLVLSGACMTGFFLILIAIYSHSHFS